MVEKETSNTQIRDVSWDRNLERRCANPECEYVFDSKEKDGKIYLYPINNNYAVTINKNLVSIKGKTKESIYHLDQTEEVEREFDQTWWIFDYVCDCDSYLVGFCCSENCFTSLKSLLIE